MNDIRRSILWVIFGFSMVMLWDQWQVYNGHKATFFPTSVTAPTQSGVPSPPASGPANSVPSAAVVAGSQAVSALPATVSKTEPALPRERQMVSTDVFKLTFDTEGGSVVQTEFLNHADMADKTRNVVLLDESKDRTYMAQSGLISGGGVGAYPTHKTLMKILPGERALKAGVNDLTVKFESAEVGGVKLNKTYVLSRGSYVVKVKHEVINTGTAPVSPQLYMQLVRDGNKPAGESSFYSTFTGPVVYTEAKKYQKVDFSDIEKGKVDIEKSAINGYAAMV